MEDASSAINIDTLTMPVPEAHRLKESALIPYLCEHIKGFHGEAEVRKFRGGQSNPTYLILSEERHYVLRKNPPDHLLPSAHAVERECRVMTALRDTGVPVPRILRSVVNINGRKIFGLLACLMLVFVLTWPLAAAEKSFELTIPGCTA